MYTYVQLNMFSHSGIVHQNSYLYTTRWEEPSGDMFLPILFPHRTCNTIPLCVWLINPNVCPLHIMVVINHSPYPNPILLILLILLITLLLPNSCWRIKFSIVASTAGMQAWISRLYSGGISKMQNFHFRTPKIHSITFCAEA